MYSYCDSFVLELGDTYTHDLHNNVVQSYKYAFSIDTTFKNEPLGGDRPIRLSCAVLKLYCIGAEV